MSATSPDVLLCAASSGVSSHRSGVIYWVSGCTGLARQCVNCQSLRCREQTAGHNALLLFVHLALTMMEGRLNNAFKDLKAKQAEVALTPQQLSLSICICLSMPEYAVHVS